jgi:hypothetical protein
VSTKTQLTLAVLAGARYLSRGEKIVAGALPKSFDIIAFDSVENA